MKDSTWMKVANVIAEEESKCISRKVAALIVNNDRLVSTGHNGTPSKQPNCCDVNNHLVDCNGRFISPEASEEHHAWSNTHEIHAEINALMYCSPDQRKDAVLYTTLFPCCHCAKAIAGSGIKKVVYGELYPRTPQESFLILESAGIEIVQVPGKN